MGLASPSRIGESASTTLMRARSISGLSVLPRIIRAKAAPNSKTKVPRCSHAFAEASRTADPPRNFTAVLPTGARAAVRAVRRSEYWIKHGEQRAFLCISQKLWPAGARLLLVSADQHVLQSLHFLEAAPGAERNAAQRIVGDGDGKARRVAQDEIEIAEQRAAAGQNNSLVDDVGSKFRCGVFERHFHRFDNGADRLGETLGDLALGDDEFLGHAVHQIAALD